MSIDKGAQTSWRKSDISFSNYEKYICTKSDRFELTYVDLLFISNFKGGNAAIHEKMEEVNEKLKSYTKVLKRIHEKLNTRPLGNLNEKEISYLKEEVIQACQLTLKKNASKIDGFGASYLSALLASYFPNLIPMLDRRVLINAALAKKSDLNNQKQVKKIHEFYGCLISFMFKKLSANPDIEIRDIDRKLFILKLPDWAKK